MRRDETYANGQVIAADVYDLESGTYTREEMGQVVSTRPLTADEIAALTPPPPPPPSPEERLAAAAQALQGLDTLPEVPDPLLPADVAARTDALAEILTDVRTALEA
jgi:hypothetical protein